jgi:hypothetical protein
VLLKTGFESIRLHGAELFLEQPSLDNFLEEQKRFHRWSRIPICIGVRGCQIFLCAKYQNGKKYIPNDHKMDQMTAKWTKRPQNVPNDHKMYQMAINYTICMALCKIYHMALKYLCASIFLCKTFPKVAQIWIFGSKICIPSGNIASDQRPNNHPQKFAVGKSGLRATAYSARVTRGRWYDHNFLRRFLPIFGEKIGVFLKNQCYDPIFAKFR